MSEDATFSFVSAGIGFLFVIVAVIIYIRTRTFINNAQEVKGTVVEMVYRTSSKGSGSYAPVYKFRTIDGQTIVVQDSLSSNPPQFQVGQEIDVLYNPENPQKSYINKWMNLYFLPALLGGMGLAFGGVGVFMIFRQFFEKLGF